MDHDGRGRGRKENKKAQTKLKNDCNQNGKQSGENYESTLSVFWIGNEANELDDNFENTPTPWGVMMTIESRNKNAFLLLFGIEIIIIYFKVISM